MPTGSSGHALMPSTTAMTEITVPMVVRNGACGTPRERSVWCLMYVRYSAWAVAYPVFRLFFSSSPAACRTSTVMPSPDARMYTR